MSEPQKKRWAVLVYMVADDPDKKNKKELLDQEANQELDQITFGALATNHEERHVAVQVDFRKQPGVLRRVIGEGTWICPESTATSWKTLHGFIRWAMKYCPADHYMLLFWGHATGPFGMFRDGNQRTFVAQTLTLPELRTVLSRTKRALKRPIDIVLFKDCFMGTLESAYEIRKLAQFLITSQSLVPVHGWPYQDILGHVGQSADVEATAMGIVNDLGRYYSVPTNRGTNRDVPFSLIDLTKLPMLVPPLKSVISGVVQALTGGSDRAKVREALAAATPGDSALVDIGALTRRLEDLGDGDLEAAAQDLESVLVNNVVSAHTSRRTPQGDRRFSGLSLFRFPSAPSEQLSSNLTAAGFLSRRVYRKLSLCTDTRWSDIALEEMPGSSPLRAAPARNGSSFGSTVFDLEVMMAPPKTGNFTININLADVLKMMEKGGRASGGQAKKKKRKTKKK
jgi:hypothetical protein